MNKLDIRNLRLADFGYNLNKTRQSLLDVILQEGDGFTIILMLAKKIMSELAKVRINMPRDAPLLPFIRKTIFHSLLTHGFSSW